MSEVKKLKTRSEISEKFKWRINKVYENINDWEKEFGNLKNEAIKLKTFHGKLNDKEYLKEYLELNERLSRILEKLYVYAHMRSHEDMANPEFQVLVNKVDNYMAEFSSYTAFFVPEVLSLDEKILEDILNNDTELKIYKRLFENILKEKPHVLSKDIEEVLASVSDCLNAPENIYSMLSNADITFDTIKDEEGSLIELTEGNYGKFIKSKDRLVREEAFKVLFGTFKKYENTMATSLISSIKNFIFMSKIRNYKSSLEASLKPNDISVDVYHNAVESINKNLSSLHRYVDIKKKLLGLDEIHLYDLYVPVVDIPKEVIEYNKAVEIVEEGLKPLGKEYLEIFNEGITNGWIDVYENKGKRTGAYSWGSYDTMPYVLLNYNEDLNDVSTLAHEMGHSIHSYYSKKNQPYIYANYPLFCAEVASITNEILLIHHLINKETDKNKKLYLINYELEQIRTTVFRQMMFAEFELKTHNILEEIGALTAQELNDIWINLNKKYFGEDMHIDKEIEIEWARIPHFYNDFYVYQYATGYAAASAFANMILEQGDIAVNNYKKFLSSGGYSYPIDVLKASGVDMNSTDSFKATIQRFNELLDMLEDLI